MHNLKSCARVSKYNLKNLLTKFNSDKKIVFKNDESVCEGCSFNLLFLDDAQKEIKNHYCNNHCNKRKTEDFSYRVVEKETSFGIFEIISDLNTALKLTKTAIKQYLVYHFIPSNSSYVKKGISFKQIAELCNISIPTAKTNHKKLESAGLIYSTKSTTNKKLMDFIIDSEYKYHAIKDDNSDNDFDDTIYDKSTQGYVTITLELLEHLISLKNVNELKVEIKKILWLDAATSPLGDNIKFNENNLVSDLPDYAKTPKNKLKLIHSSKSLFTVDTNGISKEQYENSNQVKDRLIKKAKDTVREFIDKNNNPYNEEHAKLNMIWKNASNEFKAMHQDVGRKIDLLKEWVINDLAGLIVQYNEKIVLKHLSDYINHHTYLDALDNTCVMTDIKNTGAFIRSLINKEMNIQGSVHY